jgi:hypothetical protein
VAYIRPLLLNPTEMIQLQLLASGIPTSVTVEGRVTNVRITSRRGLPYSPGTGPEGELDNFLEKGIWYVGPIVPAVVLAWIVASLSASTLAKVVAISFAVLFSLALNPMYVRYVIKRRRLWAP